MTRGPAGSDDPSRGAPYADAVIGRWAVWALGAGSVAMGAGLLAPRRAARVFGLGPRPGLMRAIAARDALLGTALLSARDPSPWLYAHALCDAVDGAAVAVALSRRHMPRGRALAWLALATTSCAVALAAAASLRPDGRWGAPCGLG